MVTDLYVQNLLSFEFICNLAKFASNVFISTTITGDYKACLGLGYDVEKIELELKGTFKFWDCAITILDDLLDFSDTWTGKEAKILSPCAQSDTRSVTFYDRVLNKAIEKELWWGTTDPLSYMGCWTIPTAPYPGYKGGFDFGQNVMKNLGNYFMKDPSFFQ